MKILVSWSSGKESAWPLHVLSQQQHLAPGRDSSHEVEPFVWCDLMARANLQNPTAGANLQKPTVGADLQKPTAGADRHKPTVGADLQKPTVGADLQVGPQDR